METESLVKLLSQISKLTPEAILALQKELSKRGKIEQVRKISDFLTSSRFLIQEESIISYLMVLRKRKLSEHEIDLELSGSFGIDQDYIDYSKSRLKSKGWESLIVGLAVIVVPLVLIVLSLIKNSYIGCGAAIFIMPGIWYLLKGLKLLRACLIL
jgi:hypothetical protein